MSPPLADEGVTEVEEYVVVWFPPDRAERQKTFKGEDALDRAREHARSEDVAEWNPLLEHRHTVTSVVAELLPIDPEG